MLPRGPRYTPLNRKGVCSDGKERSLYTDDARKALFVKRVVRSAPSRKNKTAAAAVVKYVPFVPKKK